MNRTPSPSSNNAGTGDRLDAKTEPNLERWEGVADPLAPTSPQDVKSLQ